MRLFFERTGVAWDAELEAFIDREVKRIPSDNEISEPDRRVIGALLRSMKAAIDGTRGRQGDFPDWVRTKIAPLLEDSREHVWSLRKRPGTRLTELVFALDKLNFMGVGNDREATDEEFACLAILKGIDLPWREGKPIAVGELINEVKKSVRKARREYGWPPVLREFRRVSLIAEMERGQAELERMKEQVRRAREKGAVRERIS